MTHLMTRLCSAIDNYENPIIDQITNDIYSVIEGDSLDTEEYTIKLVGDKIKIYDKLHNEYTDVVRDGDSLKLEKPIQKSFANPNKYAVLDENGKLKYITTRGNAKDLLNRNPKWTMTELTAFRQSLSDRLANFSESTKNMIIKNIFSAVENC